MTENNMERRVPTRLEKWTESEGEDGHVNVGRNAIIHTGVTGQELALVSFQK